MYFNELPSVIQCQIKGIVKDSKKSLASIDMFEGNSEVIGNPFKAIDAAVNRLESSGYMVGSMCGDDPIGFAKGVESVGKWRNILPIEYNKLDGIIVTEEWFRDAKLVYVVHLI